MKSKKQKTDEKFIRKIDKMANECGIDPLMARDMIVFDHELNALIDPKEVVYMDIDIPAEVIRQLRAIGDTLKITLDAVINTILASECEKALKNPRWAEIMTKTVRKKK